MQQKYNSVLQQRADDEKESKKKQEKLKDKFGIKGQDVVVVEGTNTFRFMVNTIISLICLLKNIIILTLTLIGILALCYPSPRAEVFLILQRAWNEIIRILPIDGFI